MHGEDRESSARLGWNQRATVTRKATGKQASTTVGKMSPNSLALPALTVTARDLRGRLCGPSHHGELRGSLCAPRTMENYKEEQDRLGPQEPMLRMTVGGWPTDFMEGTGAEHSVVTLSVGPLHRGGFYYGSHRSPSLSPCSLPRRCGLGGHEVTQFPLSPCPVASVGEDMRETAGSENFQLPWPSSPQPGKARSKNHGS